MSVDEKSGKQNKGEASRQGTPINSPFLFDMNRFISITFIMSFFFIITPHALALEEGIYTEQNTVKKILDNGMTVVMHEVHKAPIAAINIAVKTGSGSEERLAGSGISHLLEHMLFKGEGAASNTEKIRLLGGDMNGFTSHDQTIYAVTISSAYVPEALNILKDFISSPSFDALELQKEKEVVFDEIRKNKDNPAGLALDLSWASVFKEHPYKYPVIGYEDLLERIGKEELEEYHSERYSPGNLTLVVSGDIKKGPLLQEIEGVFGGLKRNFVPAMQNISEPAQLSQRRRVVNKPISLSHAVLSYKSASINDETLYPLDILAIALGEGEDSILTKQLRDKKKLVYHISCQNYTLKDSGLFYIYFVADNSKVDAAIAAVLEELEKIKQNGISDADLEKSKKIVKSEFANAFETVENRARDIAINETLVNNYNFSQFYLAKLLRATAQDVKSAANTYLDSNYLNTVLVSPEEAKEETKEMGETAKFERKVLKEMLPNGIKILVSEDHSMPISTMTALFLGGVRSEDSYNNGVSHLVSKLFLDGTAKRSEEDIKSAIESAGGSISAISGNNTFGITVNLLSDYWKKGIEIISDITQNPVFSDEKIEKEKALTAAAIKERDDDIIKSGFLLFKQNFFGEHPYRFDPKGTEESIGNIKRADIINHYESLCVPVNMVLAVAGDINANEVIAELKQQFSTYNEKKAKLPKPPAPKQPEEKKEISKTMKRAQSIVIAGFPSAKITDNDRYIFEVMDSIMSGIDGRLFRNIRDKLGVSYMLGTAFTPGLDGGCFIFYAITSASNIETVKNAILQEIKAVKKEGVTEDELKAAKRYLIASHMAELQRNKALGLTMSLDELYGLGYDNFRTYDTKINDITAGQIKRVINQYLDVEKSLIVVIRGEIEQGESL